jgi:hypothetical protein
MKFALAAIAAVAVLCPALARDNGWEDTPPNVRKWYQSLMQPDNPYISCCGEADAYQSDEYEVDGDTIVAIITDDRDDTFSNGVTRPHVPPGTKFRVPANKVKWDAGNPTGHGVIFLGGAGAIIYCYVAPGGV